MLPPLSNIKPSLVGSYLWAPMKGARISRNMEIMKTEQIKNFIIKNSKRLGNALLEQALLLLTLWQDPAISKKTKTMIAAALVYLISPFDAIPDFLVPFGFTDDATVIATLLAALNLVVKPEHRAAAKAKAKELLEKV